MAYKYSRKDYEESTTIKNRWRDFDASFDKNPVTNDLVINTDEKAVKEAVKNIVLTNFYERPFRPRLGSNIRNLLFEPMVPMTFVLIKKQIEVALNNYEPRIDLEEVQVRGNPDKNAIEVSIRFRIQDFVTSTSVGITLRRTR